MEQTQPKQNGGGRAGLNLLDPQNPSTPTRSDSDEDPSTPEIRQSKWYFHKKWKEEGYESPWDLQKLWGHPAAWTDVKDFWELDHLTDHQEALLRMARVSERDERRPCTGL
jgi:hypothetical protein